MVLSLLNTPRHQRRVLEQLEAIILKMGFAEIAKHKHREKSGGYKSAR